MKDNKLALLVVLFLFTAMLWFFSGYEDNVEVSIYRLADESLRQDGNLVVAEVVEFNVEELSIEDLIEAFNTDSLDELSQNSMPSGTKIIAYELRASQLNLYMENLSYLSDIEIAAIHATAILTFTQLQSVTTVGLYEDETRICKAMSKSYVLLNE